MDEMAKKQIAMDQAQWAQAAIKAPPRLAKAGEIVLLVIDNQNGEPVYRPAVVLLTQQNDNYSVPLIVFLMNNYQGDDSKWTARFGGAKFSDDGLLMQVIAGHTDTPRLGGWQFREEVK